MASRTAVSRLTAVLESTHVRGSRVAAAAATATATPVIRRHASSTSSSSAQSAQKDQAENPITSSKASSSSMPSTSIPTPFEPVQIHPRTHNHHVASLHLRAYGPGETFENLQFFCDFALRAGYALGIPLSRPASLPTRTSLWTVPKGPFVHKKSQENFQRRTHKRLIKVWDADMEVVERWLQFLRAHCMTGVGMRVELYRQFPLSIGASLLAATTSRLRQVPAGTSDTDDATIRASDTDSAQVARLARAIVEEEIAKQDAEDAAEQSQIETQASASHEKEEGLTGSEAQAKTENGQDSTPFMREDEKQQAEKKDGTT